MMHPERTTLFRRVAVFLKGRAGVRHAAAHLNGTARRARARAFTLMELMIVVVIMGVLATLAIYSMTGYIQNSKTAEAREVLLGIMAGQDAYKGEVGNYLDVTGAISSATFYPHDPTFNGKRVIQWGAPDTCAVGAVPCLDNFNALGVVVNTPVMFRYASTTVATGTAPSVPATFASGFNTGNVTTPLPGYVVLAVSDLEGSGDGSYTAVVGSNLQSTLHFENVGE
jgi:type IV pilus assembly protein PilA